MAGYKGFFPVTVTWLEWICKYVTGAVVYTTKPKKNFLTGFLYPIQLPNLAFSRIPRIFLWCWSLFHFIQGFLSTASRDHPSSFRELPPSLPSWVFDHFALSAQFITEWFLTQGILNLTVPIVAQMRAGTPHPGFSSVLSLVDLSLPVGTVLKYWFRISHSKSIRK